MKDFPKISVLGDRGILIEFDDQIDEVTLKTVLFYKEKLEQQYIEASVEVINTYNSLLISYMFTIEDIYEEVLHIEKLLSQANIAQNKNYRIFYLPVCYDKEFGLDLEHISTELDLSIDEIIQLHTTPLYQVYFIGFLPGFLYLGGLDKKLQISRKRTPRKEIEKGSVGIGENQTGIYPKNSPGGWQILGKSPVNLFNKNDAPPSIFSAGDRIKFEAISKEKFYSIKAQVEEGNYTMKMEEYEN